LREENKQELSQLIWSGVFILAVTGGVGAVLIAGGSGILTGRILKISPNLIAETRWCLVLIASAVPIVTVTAGVRGVLEAYHEFKALAIVKIPFGILTFLGPAIICHYRPSLVWTIAILVLSRAMMMVSMFWLCLRTDRQMFSCRIIRMDLIRRMVNFGGWITVSNILSIVMTYSDRFFIGSLTSMAEVAYYTTPFEIGSRMAILPAAFGGVLFPLLGQSPDSKNRKTTYYWSIKVIVAIFIPIILLLIFAAPHIMTVWMGKSFSIKSAAILQIISIGVCFNAVSNAPYSLIQACGRPKFTGLMHMAETALYFLVLVVFIKSFGIIGAAAAWSLRMFIDMVALLVIAQVTCVNAEPDPIPARSI
jgi:O-antigen/teichoic acid export membrane protein